jgi:hypothetical protein
VCVFGCVCVCVFAFGAAVAADLNIAFFGVFS